MSVAPFPALGRLWALGSAPAAFVRRDEGLRAALERVVETAEGSTPLADEAAYARLVATVSLASLLPEVSTSTPGLAIGAPHARREIRHPEVSSAAARSVTLGDRQSARHELEWGSADPKDPRDPHSSSTSSKDVLVNPRTTPAADVARATLEREASPVRHEPDPTVRTRVAALLSAVTSKHTRVERVTSEPAQTTSVVELLTKTVQRVEHHIADRARRASDRSAVRDEHGESRTYRTSRPAESPRSLTRATANETRTERVEDTTAQVGLRGLAARFATGPSGSASRRVRAPLLVPPNETLADWPDDPLASLLDDAARRGGVDTAEDAP